MDRKTLFAVAFCMIALSVLPAESLCYTFIRSTKSDFSSSTHLDLYPSIPEQIDPDWLNVTFEIKGTLAFYHNSTPSFSMRVSRSGYSTNYTSLASYSAQTEAAYNYTASEYMTNVEFELHGSITHKDIVLHIESNCVSVMSCSAMFDLYIDMHYSYSIEEDFYIRLPAMIMSSMPLAIVLMNKLKGWVKMLALASLEIAFATAFPDMLVGAIMLCIDIFLVIFWEESN